MSWLPALLLIPTLSLGQTIGSRTSAQIPSPADFLQSPLGSRHSRPSEIVDYYREVDRLSENVTVLRHGRTWEGRELVHAIVTSPSNQQKFERIWDLNQKARDPKAKIDLNEYRDLPLVVWLGYGVHGNEASGPEAAMWALHMLASDQDEQVTKWLESCVFILVPDYNPDGRARFVNYVNSARGQNATANDRDREHDEPWPGGRTNHYWYDLNRDWFPLTQPESYSRHAVWNKWWPHFSFDFHEMGGDSTYFFQPGVTKRTNPNTPQVIKEITEKMAVYHANALDSMNQRYFTAERYDDFYVGKGSTYPDQVGSVGILYEQASSRGLIHDAGWRALTYKQSVQNQIATSVSSIEASLGLASELRAHRQSLIASSKEGSSRAWEVFHPSGKLDPLLPLERVLKLHSIHFLRQWDKGFRLVIPQNQVAKNLLQSMFDRRKEFEDNVFYDISSWAIDLAFGLDSRMISSWSNSSTGSMPAAAIFPGTAPQGLILKGTSPDFFKVLNKLQQSGIQTFLITEPLGQGDRGDVLLFRADAPETEFLSSIRSVVSDLDADFTVADSAGKVVPWGGSTAVPLSKKSVALLAGTGTSSGDAGTLWHLMDAIWDMTINVLEPSALSNMDGMTTLVVGSAIPSAQRETVQNWVRQGGTLVAVGGSAASIGQNWLDLKLERYSAKTSGLPYGEIQDEIARHELPGSIFKVNLDLTHPLTVGLPAWLPVMRTNGVFISHPNRSGVTVGSYDPKAPLMAGYASAEVLALAPDRAAVVADHYGRGRIVLIADQVHFRAFFNAQDRLFGNAIFFSEAF